MPNTINAVVLYGKKTCDRLVEILNYWQTILTDHAWDQYLFLCVTSPEDEWSFPGEGEVTPATQELINKQVIRCMHLKLDENDPQSWSMPQRFLIELQYRLKIGDVMVHCVCDDLRTSPPVQALVSITNSASRFLEEGHVTTLYYIMLRGSFDARQKQREFAAAIHEKQPRAVVYLLSRIANDGSRLHKFELWRAIMCEILVASNGRRSYISPFVYSLGYTSLNANDQEFSSLRRHTVAELLRQHYESSLSDADAWNILLLNNHQFPYESSPYAITSLVSAWVESIASKYIIQPSARELNNLRILADINKPEKVSGLQDIIKKFFEANITSRTDRLLRNHAEKHFDEVLVQLRNHINAKEFPAALIKHVTEALNTLENSASNYMPATLPKKRLLEATDEYLTKCGQLVAANIRQYYLVIASRKLAKYLLLGLDRVNNALVQMKNHDTFDRAVQNYRLPSTEENRLTTKYPHYEQAITSTVHDGSLSLFGLQWTCRLGEIYDENFYLKNGTLSQLVEIGEDALHSHLPSGFNGTFMDALHAEFPTDIQMTNFLTQYLHIERHMFHCPFATYRTEDNVYFVDDNLQNTPWAYNNAENSIVVDNDNIEQLSFVHLEKDLGWFYEGWVNNNRYFGTHHDHEYSNVDSDWIGSGSAAGSAKVINNTESSEDTIAADDNPRKIRLTCTGDRFILSWEWEDGMNHLLVKVGNNPVRPCSVSEYLLTGGFDVTDLMDYGKNDIVLLRNAGIVYGKVSLSGKRHQVQYRFLPAAKGGVQLRMQGRIPPTNTLLLGEMTSKDTVCFYPVASRGLNGLLTFDGLMLAGKYQLMVAPEDRYPIVNPVQNISL